VSFGEETGNDSLELMAAAEAEAEAGLRADMPATWSD